MWLLWLWLLLSVGAVRLEGRRDEALHRRQVGPQRPTLSRAVRIGSRFIRWMLHDKMDVPIWRSVTTELTSSKEFITLLATPTHPPQVMPSSNRTTVLVLVARLLLLAFLR